MVFTRDCEEIWLYGGYVETKYFSNDEWDVSGIDYEVSFCFVLFWNGKKVRWGLAKWYVVFFPMTLS